MTIANGPAARGVASAAVARCLPLIGFMDEREREREGAEFPPIDESTYGGSASETGGLYHQDGPTIMNPSGDTMSEREEDENPGPESHSDG